MVVGWEGEAPPDKAEWFDVLDEALGEEAGSYWVRFYRKPEGWRFDLERHRAADWNKPSFKRADESVALHVYTLLVENGKPLDPGWRPFAPGPPRRPSGRQHRSSPDRAARARPRSRRRSLSRPPLRLQLSSRSRNRSRPRPPPALVAASPSCRRLSARRPAG